MFYFKKKENEREKGMEWNAMQGTYDTESASRVRRIGRAGRWSVGMPSDEAFALNDSGMEFCVAGLVNSARDGGTLCRY